MRCYWNRDLKFLWFLEFTNPWAFTFPHNIYYFFDILRVLSIALENNFNFLLISISITTTTHFNLLPLSSYSKKHTFFFLLIFKFILTSYVGTYVFLLSHWDFNLFLSQFQFHFFTLRLLLSSLWHHILACINIFCIMEQ